MQFLSDNMVFRAAEKQIASIRKTWEMQIKFSQILHFHQFHCWESARHLAFPKTRQDVLFAQIPACVYFSPIILHQCFKQMEMTPTKSQVHALAASLLKGICQMFLPPVNWLPHLSQLLWMQLLCSISKSWNKFKLILWKKKKRATISISLHFLTMK